MNAYFVMLNHPNPSVPAVPMVHEDDEVAFFMTKEEAEEAAKNSFLGEGYGFEVFCLGRGE